MNKKNYNKYSLLGEEVEAVTEKMKTFCKKYLYSGKIIMFKWSNMSSPAPGRIISTSIYSHRWIQVRVENLNTGKKRHISLDSIILD